MINENYISKQMEYFNYIKTHKHYVKTVWENTSKHLTFLNEGQKETIDSLIKEHDDSKFFKDEFFPYFDKFILKMKNDKEFNEAVKLHYKRNPHHPEHWNGEEMPEVYIIEMFCDLSAMCLKNKNNDLNDFYHKRIKQKIHPLNHDIAKKLLPIFSKSIDELLN